MVFGGCFLTRHCRFNTRLECGVSSAVQRIRCNAPAQKHVKGVVAEPKLSPAKLDCLRTKERFPEAKVAVQWMSLCVGSYDRAET